MLRRACTGHMRTDSADEVKHFRFVALWARRRAYAMDTRACASKLTRNARCVDRFTAKPVDSSRAVAKTCARTRADGDASTRTMHRRDTKRNLLRTSHRRALSARSHAFTRWVHTGSRGVHTRSRGFTGGFSARSRARPARRSGRADARSGRRCIRRHPRSRPNRARVTRCMTRRHRLRSASGAADAVGRYEARDQVPSFTV